jgi:phytoene dehydrogenase-like protein
VTRFNSCEWFLHFKTPVKGLYLAGQDTLVDGIVGALGSGVLCAITISPFVIFDLIATYLVEEI